MGGLQASISVHTSSRNLRQAISTTSSTLAESWTIYTGETRSRSRFSRPWKRSSLRGCINGLVENLAIDELKPGCIILWVGCCFPVDGFPVGPSIGGHFGGV